jgi:Uncharacterized protein conserved in bacteria (DUF2252)
MPHPRANGNPPKNSPRAERYEAGRALRKRVARENHADCPPASGRDPVAILAETDDARIPELLPIRYERMLQSPVTFLRGAAAVMAHDLASSPQTGAHVQAGGDCDLMNFGAFNTPEGRVHFDINDFDEALPAPIQDRDIEVPAQQFSDDFKIFFDEFRASRQNRDRSCASRAAAPACRPQVPIVPCRDGRDDGAGRRRIL